ncbi:MAG: hypothetical protein ABSE77_16155 [Acidimicrobiales bacterium]|jgi:hypothetical protein
MKRVVSTLTIAALAGALFTSGSILTASASTVTNGTVHVFNYGDGEGVGSTVVLTGAIGDSGSAYNVLASGTPGPNGTQVELSLVQGSFTINIAALGRKINSAFNKVEPNARTCSAYIVATASTPIVAGSGTGAYTGISGGFILTITIAVIGSKYPSGKHAGQCNNSNNSPSVGQAQIVTGSGTVSF